MSAPAGSAASGYLHEDYARALADAATPRHLPHCGGWFLERSIPGTDLRDGMGCYPLFACRDWSRIHLDMPALADRLVSFSLITDPFGGFSDDSLRESFDVVLPYKPHYVTQLAPPGERFGSSGHRRTAARALRRVQVDTCLEPLSMLDDWVALYAHLVERHRVTGLRAFSRASLQRQLAVPGLVMFTASADGCVVGLHLWYIQGDVAYGHLGATSARGYELMASYALYGYAIDRLRGRVRWLDLGSAAGAPDEASGAGLRRFKSGWATGTKPTYVCGRIFQPDRYARLAHAARVGPTAYFPAYRCGEFGPRTAGVDARDGGR